METGHGYGGAKGQSKIKHRNAGGVGLNSDNLLIVKLPDPETMRVMSRSVFLALVILALPYIGYVFTEPSSNSNISDSELHAGSDLISFEFVDLVFEDLVNEGLLRNGQKGLIVSSGFEGAIDSAQFLNGKDVDLVMGYDWEHLSSVHDEMYDFVFVSGSISTKLVDSNVKIGGIVVVQMSDEQSNALEEQYSNYKIVYIRRFDFPVVALKKLGTNEEPLKLSRRRLCKMALEAKKEVLKGLEEALLEPPRQAVANSDVLLKKIRYLPDLLGDSLEDYPNRVFINVGVPEDKHSVMEWFQKSYPTKNKDFDIYNLETVSKEGSSVSELNISDWLRKNVREDEYVVMKAEAEIAEEMIASGTIYLVDELFLGCKNRWREGEKRNKSLRAYWECLALYGRLMDEGVAVHQWWS